MVRGPIPVSSRTRRPPVVYFDARHSGGSNGPEDPTQYTLRHFVADIDALRMHLGEERVFVAGHLPWVEQPEQFAAAVTAWCEEIGFRCWGTRRS